MSLFPIIYDTKFLSFELRKELSRNDKWVSNVLNEMYIYFKNSNGVSLALYSPSIKSTNGYNFNDSEGTFHEAGWDSYCTGYCFIRMAHIFASRFYGRNAEPRPLSSTEHLAAVSKMKNSINIVRANISHICLDGPDPKSNRPRLLHIRAKGSKVIDLSEVTELFAQFGAVDAKLFNKQRALVAVGNYRIAREALHKFKDHKDLEVKLYSTLYHSPVARTLLWGGLTLSAVSCVAALVMFLRRVS